jgi:hypothetical protein
MRMNARTWHTHSFSANPQKVLGIRRTMSGRLIMSHSVAELPDVFGVVFGEILVFAIPIRQKSKVSNHYTTSRDSTPR